MQININNLLIMDYSSINNQLESKLVNINRSIDSNVNTGDIRTYEIRDPVVTGLTVPVTVSAGKPIVNIPGCVKAHKDGGGKNKNLVDDDPKGVMTYCDGSQPSFSPMDYNSDEITFEQKKYEPDFKIDPPPVPAPPELPSIENLLLIDTTLSIK